MGHRIFMMHRHCCYCCLYIWKCKGLKIYFFFIEIENSFRLKYKILLLVSKRMSDFIKRITHTAWMMLDVQICYHDILTRLWPILMYFYYLYFQHIDISVIHLFFLAEHYRPWINVSIRNYQSSCYVMIRLRDIWTCI